MDLGPSELFQEQGFTGAIPLFSETECKKILAALRKEDLNPEKGFFAPKNSLCLNDLIIAQFPSILSQVASQLGQNVILWGASLIRRFPDQIHPWHSDIETADSKVRSVSVWIGLEGTTENSSLQLVTCSHLFDESLQEARHRHSINRTDATSKRVLELAQEKNPHSCIHSPCRKNGEAIFFDGRIWHGSHNLESDTVRTALLLQYISTDSVIRVPAPKALDWPFQYIEGCQPQVYLVNGTDTFSRNNVMKLPSRTGLDGLSALVSNIHQIPLPIPENPDTGWNSHAIWRGPSSQLNDLASHASVLSPGCVPHPPHQHPEDEVLLVLDGEIDIQLVNDDKEEWIKLQRGSFSYYPAGQLHTLHNKSSEPVHYVMFKWFSDVPCDSSDYLKTSITRSPSQSTHENDFHSEVVLEGPTRSLQKFHAHYSTLKPGAGYPPHADAYDVAIVTLKGTIETLGEEVGPNNVIFYAAGDLHGMRNIGDETAEYLVFEFHGIHSLEFQKSKEQLRSVEPATPKLPINRRLLKPIEQFAKKIIGVSPKA